MKALATILLGSLISTAALAQPVYRCGSTYSQTACPQGGRIVDATDPRSAAQRAEARRVTADERRLAADMRRDRLADEKALKPGRAASLSGVAAPAAPASGAVARHPNKKKRTVKAVTSDDFTAVDPSSRKRRRGS